MGMDRVPERVSAAGVGPEIEAGFHGLSSPTSISKAEKEAIAALADAAQTVKAASDQVASEPVDPVRAKPKQKRNKPTLSCLECVERKTKCDRGRPCVACVKRQSQCEYTAVANFMASRNHKGKGLNGRAHHVGTPPNKIRRTSAAPSTPNSAPLPSPASTGRGWRNPDASEDRPSPSTAAAVPGFQFSSVPYSQDSPSNVFGLGSQHPFANFWTLQGGLPEVITVLPQKHQADILIAKYFEAVDPVYPFIHRRMFYSEYEAFWALPVEEKDKADASLVALQFAMYALGTQFTHFHSYEEGSQTAEFYCSASNQALRVYSYLNRTSLRAIQAMLLITYFLMNDNHASDAYAWAGIHLRQAYAMRLNRNPDVVVPGASVVEKQQRRKLWQAVFHHDTSLTMLLKLPPTATHSDVPVESLADAHELSTDGLDTCLGTHSRVENLMSISVIAPQTCVPLPPPQPHQTLEPSVMKSDIAYMRSMWHLGNLIQEHLSSAVALSLPVANSPRHKESLVAAFRRLHKSFPASLTVLDFQTLQQQVDIHPRKVRQNLFLTSNYHHALMLLQASENAAAGVEINVKATLEAAHEALWAFFKLWALFEGEAGVWWVFQHQALEESLLIAELLRNVSSAEFQLEAIYAKAKEDISRMLGIMDHYGGNTEMHRVRKRVLQDAFDRIPV